MKNIKSIIYLGCFLFPFVALSQTNPPIKKIEVAGKAEMEITPDEITVRITLKEYVDGRRKVEMNKLESALVKAVKAEGFSETDLKVENIFGYNWNWKKQRSEDFLATNSFNLKVTTLKKINSLLERLDERGINGVNIVSYTHSKLKHYNKELQLQALKNAKEKAIFLLEGIEERLGPVIEVQELSHQATQPVFYRAQSLEAADAAGYESDLEFKTIKLSAQIRAVFAII